MIKETAGRSYYKDVHKLPLPKDLINYLAYKQNFENYKYEDFEEDQTIDL